MRIAASNRVIARNGIGQFTAECAAAARDTIDDAVTQGAQISRHIAPKGNKPDPRTSKLGDSIEPRVLSRTSGQWVATARHALPQELGASAHTISGNPDLAFFWEKEGRMFLPASTLFGGQFGFPAVTTVSHPGNAPQPYLRPAYEAIMARLIQIARSNYP